VCLWSHLSFSSGNNAASALSWFYGQINFIDRLSKWEVSCLRQPSEFCLPSSILSKVTTKWVNEYMPRFYDQGTDLSKTNLGKVNAIVRKSFEKDSTIETKYNEINKINWNDPNMTYQGLQEHIKMLVEFYNNYKSIFQEIASIAPCGSMDNNANKKIPEQTVIPKYKTYAPNNKDMRYSGAGNKRNHNKSIFLSIISFVIFKTKYLVGLVLLKIQSLIYST
jgi:hypothetical protein